jgi:trans-aconitate 2-methyltransferase
MGRTWGAGSYDKVGGPMTAMALAVLDRLELRGDEAVVDAGCGTGRVTEHLLERVPQGRVIAVDADPAMVEKARAVLRDRAEVRQADLLELTVDEPVDAVLSTATFHWVLDHERLFRQLLGVLRPGGQLVAQCGGAGNIVGLLRATDEVVQREGWAGFFAGWSRPMRYATAEETAAILEAAGFTDVRCWLQPHAVIPEEPHEYLGSIPLGAHLDRLPEDRRDAFVDEVVARLPEPVTVDYVRLNIDARRPSSYPAAVAAAQR